MANYYTKCRSNDFTVTNEEKFEKLCNRLCTESAGDEKPFYKYEYDENRYFLAFEGPFSYLVGNENEETFAEDSYTFFNNLMELLPEGECVIFTEIGWEKLECVTANALVLTKDKMEWVNLDTVALEKARELLKNPDYEG